uniref:Uncharacterized protein n=1 Tax=Ralstonia solanacearum TaxID=305 RepID=A0A809E4K1_RALSL
MIHDQNSNGSEKESGRRSARRAPEGWKAIDGATWAGRISGFQGERRGKQREGVRADFTFSYKAGRYRNGDFSGQRWPRALK